MDETTISIGSLQGGNENDLFRLLDKDYCTALGGVFPPEIWLIKQMPPMG
jgi:hypothetical protein